MQDPAEAMPAQDTRQGEQGPAAARSKVTYRTATVEDERQLWYLLELMYQEIALAPMSVEKVYTVMRDAIERGVVLVAEADGEIVGTAGCQIGSPWWSYQEMLSERWVFVRQDWRRHRPLVVDGLLVRIKAVAKKIGMPLAIGIYNTKRTAAKNRLYRRHFRQVGEMFFQEG